MGDRFGSRGVRAHEGSLQVVEVPGFYHLLCPPLAALPNLVVDVDKKGV